MTPNRIVILLSPIFIALAGWLTELAARYLPGAPKLDSTELAAIFVAGALFATTKVLAWLRGWQAHEHQVARHDEAHARRSHEQHAARLREAGR